MAEFALWLFIDLIVFFVVFSMACFTASYFALSSEHGNLQNWNTQCEAAIALLAAAHADVSNDGKLLRLRSALTVEEIAGLGEFLAVLRLHERAKMRMNVLRKPRIFVPIAIIYAISAASVGCIPLLLGMGHLSSSYPFFYPFAFALPIGIFYAFYLWRNAHSFLALKEYVSEMSNRTAGIDFRVVYVE